jgi:hypothetical protein
MTNLLRHARHRLQLLCSSVLLLLAACAPVSDTPQLRVIATDPGSAAVLGAQQRFHIKFALDSKTPLVVTLDPYFEHQPLSANLGTSAPVKLPAGGGSAVAYLFFWGDYATRVDEIRLVARAPKQAQPAVELALPVKLSWVSRAVAPRETAAWVVEAQKNSTTGSAGASERERWLAFGAVILAIAVAGFANHWLRQRRRARRQAEE